jgi:hypothetical protein
MREAAGNTMRYAINNTRTRQAEPFHNFFRIICQQRQVNTLPDKFAPKIKGVKPPMHSECHFKLHLIA